MVFGTQVEISGESAAGALLTVKLPCPIGTRPDPEALAELRSGALPDERLAKARPPTVIAEQDDVGLDIRYELVEQPTGLELTRQSDVVVCAGRRPAAGGTTEPWSTASTVFLSGPVPRGTKVAVATVVRVAPAENLATSLQLTATGEPVIGVSGSKAPPTIGEARVGPIFVDDPKILAGATGGLHFYGRQVRATLKQAVDNGETYGYISPLNFTLAAP